MMFSAILTDTFKISMTVFKLNTTLMAAFQSRKVANQLEMFDELLYFDLVANQWISQNFDNHDRTIGTKKTEVMHTLCLESCTVNPSLQWKDKHGNLLTESHYWKTLCHALCTLLLKWTTGLLKPEQHVAGNVRMFWVVMESGLIHNSTTLEL